MKSPGAEDGSTRDARNSPIGTPQGALPGPRTADVDAEPPIGRRGGRLVMTPNSGVRLPSIGKGGGPPSAASASPSPLPIAYREAPPALRNLGPPSSRTQSRRGVRTPRLLSSGRENRHNMGHSYEIPIRHYAGVSQVDRCVLWLTAIRQKPHGSRSGIQTFAGHYPDPP